MIKGYLIKTDLKSGAEVSDLARTHVVKLASQNLQIPNEKVIIQEAEHRKPYINGYPNWLFNISHTCGMIAIAVGQADRN